MDKSDKEYKFIKQIGSTAEIAGTKYKINNEGMYVRVEHKTKMSKKERLKRRKELQG